MLGVRHAFVPAQNIAVRGSCSAGRRSVIEQVEVTCMKKLIIAGMLVGLLGAASFAQRRRSIEPTIESRRSAAGGARIGMVPTAVAPMNVGPNIGHTGSNVGVGSHAKTVGPNAVTNSNAKAVGTHAKTVGPNAVTNSNSTAVGSNVNPAAKSETVRPNAAPAANSADPAANSAMVRPNADPAAKSETVRPNVAPGPRARSIGPNAEPGPDATPQ